MTANIINELCNELKEKGWNLLKFEQVHEPNSMSEMWVYRIQKANEPHAKIYGTGIWCESAEIAIKNVRDNINRNERPAKNICYSEKTFGLRMQGDLTLREEYPVGAVLVMNSIDVYCRDLSNKDRVIVQDKNYKFSIVDYCKGIEGKIIGIVTGWYLSEEDRKANKEAVLEKGNFTV